jgi:hypothetical protein
MRKLIVTLAPFLSIVLLCASQAVHATSIHKYGKHEFSIIVDGRAPNKRFSVASHQDGESNGEFWNERFNLYLMAEPAHRKIAPLDLKGKIGGLDTGADAYSAIWSADSRRVAVRFRSSRHIGEIRLYEIRGRRPHLLDNPSLLKAVDKNLAGFLDHDDQELRSSYTELTWLSPTKFLLKEGRLFHVSTTKLAGALGTFEKQTIDEGTKSVDHNNNPVVWYFVEFSAEATCELVGRNQYRITDMKPGQFDYSAP